MSYKTILVHVDASRHTPQRVRVAASIAALEGAHLVGVATTGVSRYLYAEGADQAGTPFLIAYMDQLRDRAKQALQVFEDVVREIGVPSSEKRLIDDEASGGISLQGRFSDLVVIGQTDLEDTAASAMPDFPEYVVLNSGRPVLVVPHSWKPAAIGQNVLVAWNASTESTRAVTNAIPFLKHARSVKVVIFNAASQPDIEGDVPGNDIALFLARHGIKIEVLRKTASASDIGDALLTLATESAADSIVMGGYGHSRFREILLGGATRTVLEAMTVPVLMSH